jgi:hypothetical protein
MRFGWRFALQRKGTNLPQWAQRKSLFRRLLWRTKNLEEGVMQMAITFMAVVAGLIFSVAIALLAEEVIFGQVLRLFAVRQEGSQAAVKSGQKR